MIEINQLKGKYMLNKNEKNIIAIAILAILIICLIILLVLNAKNLFDREKPVNTDKYDSVVLKETKDAGESYLDKMYFVGDSTTYHFFKGGIDKSRILMPESLTLMLDTSICEITVGNTGLTIPESIKKNKAKIVIITLGVNGADSFSEVKYKTYYNKLINKIKELSPDTKIILQSAFPVTDEYSNRDNGISNSSIDNLNQWLKEIACDQELPYLDTQSILKNENGDMKEEYSEGDGVHMNPLAYEAILEYIRTHAIE